MPIMIQRECPCCRMNLHHCKKCWDRFHNGEKHKDYEPPEYYGKPFISEDIKKKVAKMLNEEYKPEVELDKDREYKEGDYGH